MGYQNLLRALKSESEILGARIATMSKTFILVPVIPTPGVLTESFSLIK